jgi:hypothetical protein
MSVGYTSSIGSDAEQFAWAAEAFNRACADIERKAAQDAEAARWAAVINRLGGWCPDLARDAHQPDMHGDPITIDGYAYADNGRQWLPGGRAGISPRQMAGWIEEAAEMRELIASGTLNAADAAWHAESPCRKSRLALDAARSASVAPKTQAQPALIDTRFAALAALRSE